MTGIEYKMISKPNKHKRKTLFFLSLFSIYIWFGWLQIERVYTLSSPRFEAYILSKGAFYTTFTASLGIKHKQTGELETLPLYDYYDASPDWQNYISEIHWQTPSQLIIEFHPSIIAYHYKNILFDKSNTELEIGGALVTLIIPTEAEAAEWKAQSLANMRGAE